MQEMNIFKKIQQKMNIFHLTGGFPS